MIVFAIKCSMFIAVICLLAALPATPLADKGQELFADDFDRGDLAPWKALIPTFTVENGVLKGVQTRDDHGAVGRVYLPMKDVIVEFRFQLAGSPSFNAVFDDQKFKGSHAGHICRAAFAAKQVRLGDDKEGAMKNDLFALRSDPARKAELTKLLVDRGSSAPVRIEQNKWYQATIELVGDQMRVSLDGKPVGYLKSPGLAHATKTSFHFTVPGSGVLFDDVHIWQAR